MYKALYLSPMIPSYNLTETGNFFTEVLEFEPVMQTPAYAIYQKNNLTIHLLPAGPQVGEMEFYLEVDDVDQVWKSMEHRLAGIKVKAPFIREYGMREIHIAVPHTNTLLFIGQVWPVA